MSLAPKEWNVNHLRPDAGHAPYSAIGCCASSVPDGYKKAPGTGRRGARRPEEAGGDKRRQKKPGEGWRSDADEPPSVTEAGGGPCSSRGRAAFLRFVTTKMESFRGRAAV